MVGAGDDERRRATVVAQPAGRVFARTTRFGEIVLGDDVEHRHVRRRGEIDQHPDGHPRVDTLGDRCASHALTIAAPMLCETTAMRA